LRCGSPGGFQLDALLLLDAKSIEQEVEGIAAWVTKAALQVADGAHTHAGGSRQLFLCHTCSQPPAPEPEAER
jgi:hypothetical protein